MKGSEIRMKVKEMEEKTIQEIIEMVKKNPFKEIAYFFAIDIDTNETRIFYKKNKQEIKKHILKEINSEELKFNQFYCLISMYTEGFASDNNIIMDIIESKGPNAENAKILWIINIVRESMIIETDEALEEISRLV